jgi:hypothetical protein
MASAKQCDVCGKFYPTPRFNDSVRICLDLGNYGDRNVDLCNDCYKKLCDFIKPALPKNFSVWESRNGE